MGGLTLRYAIANGLSYETTPEQGIEGSSDPVGPSDPARSRGGRWPDANHTRRRAVLASGHHTSTLFYLRRYIHGRTQAPPLWIYRQVGTCLHVPTYGYVEGGGGRVAVQQENHVPHGATRPQVHPLPEKRGSYKSST